jgi:hypothetical protein
MPMRAIFRSVFTGDHVIVLLQLHAVIVHSRAGSLSSSIVACSEGSFSFRSRAYMTASSLAQMGWHREALLDTPLR